MGFLEGWIFGFMDTAEVLVPNAGSAVKRATNDEQRTSKRTVHHIRIEVRARDQIVAARVRRVKSGARALQ